MEVHTILDTVSLAIVQPPVTMWELLQRRRADETSLSLMSCIPELRLIKGSITELVGSAGMGKSQACMMMCVSAAFSPELNGMGGGVVYIDTESTFAPSRVVEIACQRFPHLADSPGTLDELTSVLILFILITRMIQPRSRIIVFQETSTAGVLERLHSLEAVLIEKNIKLIVLDSIAAPVRQRFDSAHMSERQDFLGEIASVVKYLAEKFDISVLITNQVTTKFGTAENQRASYLHPALGVGFLNISHNCTKCFP